MSDSVRHLERFDDSMRRYHGDIERNVYAAEILCGGTVMCAKSCPFHGGRTFCKLHLVRMIIGDAVKQHHTDGDGK
jgi:hypothetical protein